MKILLDKSPVLFAESVREQMGERSWRCYQSGYRSCQLFGKAFYGFESVDGAQEGLSLSGSGALMEGAWVFAEADVSAWPH